MKSFLAFALAASTLAKPTPQSSTPDGCQDSRDGSFQVSVTNVTQQPSKRSIERRQQSGILTLTLEDGNLKDQAGRTGYIASNHQFQFDQPVQAGALETSGFSVCSNGTLALGGSAIWYQCFSGDFYNLYDESQGEQCNAIYIYAQSSGGSSQTGAVTQASDGQPAASTQVTAPISQLTDGQPQAPTGAPVISQISDGQPQAPTGAPVISQISDGQPQVPTAAPAPSGPVVSQISDGQPQVPTAAPAPSGPVISQISDGQPQVPTAAPAPSGPVVSQISDGQPQVPTAAPAPSGPLISQISDGQPQVPTASATLPQAPLASANYTIPNATAPVSFPGAASMPMVGVSTIVAGLLAMVFMLFIL